MTIPLHEYRTSEGRLLVETCLGEDVAHSYACTAAIAEGLAMGQYGGEVEITALAGARRVLEGYITPGVRVYWNH